MLVCTGAVCCMSIEFILTQTDRPPLLRTGFLFFANTLVKSRNATALEKDLVTKLNNVGSLKPKEVLNFLKEYAEKDTKALGILSSKGEVHTMISTAINQLTPKERLPHKPHQ